MAAAEGLSHSKLAKTFIQEGMRQKLHIRHAVMLQPLLEDLFAKERQRDRTRFASLLVRVAIEIGQNRILTTNILGRQPGVTVDQLNTILDRSRDKARQNITTRTPEITGIIAAVEEWLADGEEEQEVPESA
jgi:hypothetical protein